MLLIALFLIIIFYFLYDRFTSENKNLNFPPGPPSYPLIGSLFHVLKESTSLIEAFRKFSVKYGPIYRLKLGSIDTLVITSCDGIKELGQNDDLIDRIDHTWILDRLNGLSYGLLFSRGKFWQDTRRYSHRVLKDNGFSKSTKMEKIMTEIVAEFTDYLRSKAHNVTGKSYEYDDEFNLVFLSFTYAISMGKRLELFHPTIKKIVHISEEMIKAHNIGGAIYQLYPWIGQKFPHLSGYIKYYTLSKQLAAAVDEILEEEIRDGKYLTDPEGLTENFLNMIENSEKTEGTYDSIYKKDNLSAVLQDLMIGGNDTQANTMKFALRFLIQHLRVQKKCQEEVDQIIGTEREAQIADFNKLKYVQATLTEILRISSVAYTVPRQAYKDIKLGKYDIKKGTMILPFYYLANRDESVFENPYEFRPERFLNDFGELVNLDKIQSFGKGKRSCIGEVVAKQGLLFLLTSLFQKFDFEFDPETGVPTDEIVENSTLTPAPFKIIIKCRY